MIKYFCEICGQEIYEPKDRVSISLYREVAFATFLKGYEVCPKCFRKIKKFIAIEQSKHKK